MPLFESKEQKRRREEKERARRQVAINMGKQKVKNYTSECRNMSAKYQDMAKEALSLGDDSGCEIYLCRKLQYKVQASKWDAFLLRMEDFIMQGKMGGAMEGLLSGMQALVKEVNSQASSQQLSDVMTDVNLAMAQVGQKEEEFTQIMNSVQLDMGAGVQQEQQVDIPESMKEDIAREKDALMDEVVVEEKVGGGSGRKTKSKAAGGDDRIKKGLDRIRELKKS